MTVWKDELLQRKKNIHHRLMLRYIRIKTNPLHEQRKISRFLTALRQPFRIQVRNGCMQMIVRADVPEHRAAPSGKGLADYADSISHHVAIDRTQRSTR